VCDLGGNGTQRGATRAERRGEGDRRVGKRKVCPKIDEIIKLRICLSDTLLLAHSRSLLTNCRSLLTHSRALLTHSRALLQEVNIEWRGPFVCVAILKTEKALVPYVHSSDGYADVC
jgi:hypothetical protein